MDVQDVDIEQVSPIQPLQAVIIPKQREVRQGGVHILFLEQGVEPPSCGGWRRRVLFRVRKGVKGDPSPGSNVNVLRAPLLSINNLSDRLICEVLLAEVCRQDVRQGELHEHFILVHGICHLQSSIVPTLLAEVIGHDQLAANPSARTTLNPLLEIGELFSRHRTCSCVLVKLFLQAVRVMVEPPDRIPLVELRGDDSQLFSDPDQRIHGAVS
mmetsp:Transcript_54588/g.127303  ORF Transcript_54588/g.127303 Transcript_54588/m.127303 type:complete len:213 (-) Transcript_54588:250-888(-)